VVSEYVIRGNTAVLKCNIPSFVADFVKVESWVGSEGTVYLPSADYGKVTTPTTMRLMCHFAGLSLTFLFLAGNISCNRCPELLLMYKSFSVYKDCILHSCQSVL